MKTPTIIVTCDENGDIEEVDSPPGIIVIVRSYDVADRMDSPGIKKDFHGNCYIETRYGP